MGAEQKKQLISSPYFCSLYSEEITSNNLNAFEQLFPVFLRLIIVAPERAEQRAVLVRPRSLSQRLWRGRAGAWVILVYV